MRWLTAGLISAFNLTLCGVSAFAQNSVATPSHIAPPPTTFVNDSGELTELNSPVFNLADQPATAQPMLLEVTPLQLDGGEIVVVESAPEIVVPDTPAYEFGDWLGYNATDSDWTWIAAGNDLGMFSLKSYPTIGLGENNAIKIGTGFHFLDGPYRPDMPPRLFDFEMAFVSRSVRSDDLIVDLKIGVGVFSDFEGSAREGVRFPGHLVGYLNASPDLAGVLGIDVLDRDDITLLPVIGFVWRPSNDIVMEAVFPRPRLQYRFSERSAFYIGGELGGDTWAMERTDGRNDVATYRDIRITCGILDLSDPQDSVIEVGYALDRRLEYRSGDGDYSPDGAFILRFRQHF